MARGGTANRHHGGYCRKNLFTWISRFGSPKIITTDQGSQFESNPFEALTKLLGTKRARTTACHPESNGLVERWHRSLKAAIMCQANAEWVDALPIVLIGLRTCYKEDIRASTAEFLYGKTLRIPGEFFDHEDMLNDPQPFVEPFRRHAANGTNTRCTPFTQQTIRFQRFIHLYTRFSEGRLNQTTTGTTVHRPTSRCGKNFGACFHDRSRWQKI